MGKLFKDISDIVYIKDGVIGSGSSAVIKKVMHRKIPNQIFAMKEMQKSNELELKYIKKEIKIHSSLNSNYIVKLYDYIETTQSYFLFLEYCENEDLFELIMHRDNSQKNLLKIFYQICNGVKDIHDRNIIHRDLKPENIFLDKDLNAKIGDMGWSAAYSKEFARTSMCGTLEYNPPEVFICQKQSKKVDIWSLGCLLYFMFHKYPPFEGTSIFEIREKMLNIEKNLHFSTQNSFINKLIRKILKFNPEERPTIDEIILEPIELQEQNRFCNYDKDEIYHYKINLIRISKKNKKMKKIERKLMQGCEIKILQKSCQKQFLKKLRQLKISEIYQIEEVILFLMRILIIQQKKNLVKIQNQRLNKFIKQWIKYKKNKGKNL